MIASISSSVPRRVLDERRVIALCWAWFYLLSSISYADDLRVPTRPMTTIGIRGYRIVYDLSTYPVPGSIGLPIAHSFQLPVIWDMMNSNVAKVAKEKLEISHE